MKVFKLTVFFILVLAVYTGITSFHPVAEGMTGVAVEKATGNVVAVSENRYVNFYGAFPWRFSVETRPQEKYFTHSVVITIPELKDLKEDSWKIEIPLKLNISIKEGKVRDLNFYRDSEGPEKFMAVELDSAVNRYLSPCLTPVYRPESLAASLEKISQGMESFKELMESYGLAVNSLEPAGLPVYPDRKLYEEGLAQAFMLRKTAAEGERKMLEISSRLKTDAASQDGIYRHYREMSSIIKENPDILKYIYIDKMAGNLKLIISSDRTAFPEFLEDKNAVTSEPKAAKRNNSGEVDNLKQ